MPTIAETIGQQLADEILTGDINPGQRIEENAVAERFGVSRTPVRDALRQLAATGLVEIKPHKGVTVVDLDIDQLSDLFEAQAEIEALCASFSAQRMTPIERKKLEQLLEGSKPAVAATNDADYSSSNEEFHKSIYQGSHNASLEQVALNLWNRVAPFRRSVFFKRGNRMQHSFCEHEDIVAAIASGDKELAGQSMRDHVINSSINAIDYLVSARQESSVL